MKLPNSPEVDSLRIRIPTSLIQDYKEQTITNRSLEVDEMTGEVIKVKNKGHRIRISDSASIHVDIQNVKTSVNTHTECLIILLNSKILEERYFEGITPNNIRSVYDKLIASGLFYFDYDTFLNADVTDLDIKFDEVLTETERIELVRATRKMVIDKRTDSVKAYLKPTTRNNNSIGIQFNQRSKATQGKPFFKMYSKGSESKHKDIESATRYNEQPFFDTHFDYKDIENVFRLETTIKDKKHAKYLGIESMKLADVIGMPTETKILVFRKMFAKYLTNYHLTPKAKPKESKITPQDIVLFNSMLLLIDNTDKSIDAIIEGMISNITQKQTRYRVKTRITEIYERNIQGTAFDVTALDKKIGTYFEKFGKW
jgi:hypothetical protein